MGHASILKLLLVQAGVLYRLACAERATDDGTFEEVWQQLAHADGATRLSVRAGAAMGAPHRSPAAGSKKGGAKQRLEVEAAPLVLHGGVGSFAAGSALAAQPQVAAGASEPESQAPVASALEVAEALGGRSSGRPPETAAHRSNSNARAPVKAVAGAAVPARPAASSLEALEVTGLQAHLMRGRVVGAHALGPTVAQAANVRSQAVPAAVPAANVSIGDAARLEAEPAAVAATNVSVGNAALVEVRTGHAAAPSATSAGTSAAATAACHDGVGCRRGGDCACASFQQCYPHHEGGEDVGVCQTAMSVLAVGSVAMIVIFFTLFTVVRYALEGGEQPSDAATAS